MSAVRRKRPTFLIYPGNCTSFNHLFCYLRRVCQDPSPVRWVMLFNLKFYVRIFYPIPEKKYTHTRTDHRGMTEHLLPVIYYFLVDAIW